MHNANIAETAETLFPSPENISGNPFTPRGTGHASTPQRRPLLNSLIEAGRCWRTRIGVGFEFSGLNEGWILNEVMMSSGKNFWFIRYKVGLIFRRIHRRKARGRVFETIRCFRGYFNLYRGIKNILLGRGFSIIMIKWVW